MNQALVNVPDFTSTIKITGLQYSFVFATDNEHQKILFIKGQSVKVFDYEDIISVELMEDNKSITKKSTGRTIGGAVLGGVIAGGVGAIIGGLSGSSEQQNLHTSVRVKILLRNSSFPSIELICFDAGTMTVDGRPVKGDDSSYLAGLSQARKITDIITVIIDAIDRAKAVRQDRSSSKSGSVAEEIAKLAVLKEKGILTEEEYALQKAKTLGDAQPTEEPGPLKLELPNSYSCDDELRSIMASQGKLAAMKWYKETMGVSLFEAKDYVDSLG